MIRKVLRYQNVDQKTYINEGQKTQWTKEKGTKGQSMMYKTLHRKLKMTTNDITNQITITIYLLHYLIKLFILNNKRVNHKVVPLPL